QYSPYGAARSSPTFPSFLPKKTLNTNDDRVLTGTPAKPALTVEGEGIEVKTPHWSVLINVSGPVVPGEGLPNQQPYTTCTWTVTMANATGPVPLALGNFNTI